MRKLLSAICATALTASVAVTGALPAGAAPVFMPKAPTVERSDVVKVQDFRWKKRGNWNNGNNFRHGNNWNGNWNNGNNWKNNNKYGWYNGHRGYRYRRDGYRYYNGFWVPAGAFIAGAIIGGAIANNNNYYNNGYGGGSAHVQWCYDRYRSYRAYDNTFQPYNGPRQQCYSPYS